MVKLLAPSELNTSGAWRMDAGIEDLIHQLDVNPLIPHPSVMPRTDFRLFWIHSPQKKTPGEKKKKIFKAPLKA